MPDLTLDAGKLRHKIEIQRKTQVQDPETGIVSSEWATIAKPWASVEPVSVREFIAAGAKQATVDTRMVIRYREDVDATCRVLFRGKTYDIQGALPDPVSGREYLTLACTAGASNG